MVKLYKIKFIKDTELKKIGEIGEATKKNAEQFIKNGYAEYVEEPKKRKPKKKVKKNNLIESIDKNIEQEAKWLSDVETLEIHLGKWKKDYEGYLIKDTQGGCIEKRVSLENSDKWVKLKNEEIKKQKLIQKTKDKINSWAHNYKQNSVEIELEIKEFAEEVKGLYSIYELKRLINIEIKNRKEKVKGIEEEDEKINKERWMKELEEKDIKEQVLTLLLLKKKEMASELIVEKIKENNYIYTTKDDIKPEIWIYKNGIYVPQGKSEIEKQVRDLLGEAFSITLSNEIIHKIKADTQIELDEFFKTNYIDEVPVENGILNIFTKELKSFDPTKIFFNKIPITYNPESRCDTISKFFEDVLKDESDVPVILEIFGFAMLKEYRFEKAFMFVGSGRNGKSKTIELLKRMLGIENCCSVPLSQITAESTSVCELFGKMVNLAGDLSNDSLKKTGMFKQTVGRDLISAKRKYLRDLPFVNHAKHIFACNELPKVYDLSDGFWTKWVLLEFPYKFIPQKEFDSLPEQERINKKILDPDIIEKITTPEEMSGLLNLSLDALKKLIEEKDFSYSKGTAEIKDFWIRQSDSFTAFCMDNLLEDYNGKVSQKKLRKEYNFYCKRHKLKGCGDKAIKATLEDRYGAVIVQNWEDKQRYWEGIKLKNE